MKTQEKKNHKENRKVKGGALFYRGIRLKLIAAFFIPVFLIILLGTVSYQKASQSVINNYEKATRQTIEKTAQYLDLVFEMIISNQVEILMDSNIFSYYNGEYKGNPLKENEVYDSISQKFLSKVMGGKFISNIHIFSAQGKPVSTAGILDSSIFSKFSEEPLAAELEQRNNEIKFIASRPHLDEMLKLDNSNYAISAVRCFYEKGKVNGYLFIDVKRDVIDSVMDSLELGENSRKNIISADGEQLIFNQDDMVFSEQDFYQNALIEKENSGSRYVSIEEKEYLFLYAKINSANALVCGLVPKADIIKETAEIKNITVYIVLFACLIAVLIGAVLAAGIGTAISRIIVAVGFAARGDFTAEIKMKRKDEFGILSGSIKDMLFQITKLIKKIREISSTVTKEVSGVENASEIFLTMAKDISVSIEEIETGAAKQAEDSEECLNQMVSLADKITIVNEAVVKIEQYAANTRVITKDGLSMMNELGKISEDTIVITKEVVSDIELLETESERISTITNIMDEIAEQTSLLSLNAFIEAARGKDGSSGFAVVAKEIEKLAKQSKEATDKIQEIVKVIKNQTKNTVKTAKRADETIASQESTLRKSMDIFYNMEKHMNDLAIDLNKIMGEIQSIQDSKNETMQAIENITAISSETAAESKAVDEMTKRQLGEAERLYHFAGELLANAQQLEEEVSVFKIKE